LSTFARGDSGYDISAILYALIGVKATGATGDSLNHQPGVFVY
jgi:hypothetical protein